MFPVPVHEGRTDSQFEGVKILPGLGPSVQATERRQHRRFPISARSRYLVDGEHGSGTTVNISSGGVFLQTAKALAAGRQIQIWIDWPALLDQRCPLRLVIVGRILRSGREGAAVEIGRYSFHLGPKRKTPAAG